MALAFLAVASTGFLDTPAARYAFTGWCSGPDTIAGLLWAPAIFELARADQRCAVLNGISSGADGELCTSFNETLFLEHGGGACLATDALSDLPRYPPNPNLPGCDAAYTSYRAATTPAFTCDCNGDHAMLGGSGGLRSGTVFTLMTLISTTITALIGPAMGTWIDHTGGKRFWYITIIISGLSMFGNMVLGSGYVWLVGLISQLITGVATELSQIPRQSYVHDLVAPNPEASPNPQFANLAYQSAVSSQRLTWSYLAQILFVVIAFPLSLFITSTTVISMIITALAGLWFLGHFLWLLPKMHNRKATRSSAGRGVCAVACGQLWSDLLEMKRDFPEALKYLGFLFVVQNGLATTAISIASSFTLDQLRFSGMQQQIMYVCVLVFGPLWIKLFQKITRSSFFSFKRMLVVVVFIWILAVFIIGYIVNNMGVVDGAFTGGYILFLCVASFLLAPGFTWYYALYWPAFMALVPKQRINQFGGVFSTVRTLGLLPQPLIYVATSQGFSSAALGRQVGLLLLIAWSVASLPLLLWVNWERGVATADAKTAEEWGAVEFSSSADSTAATSTADKF
jgi:hypothetical protein